MSTDIIQSFCRQGQDPQQLKLPRCLPAAGAVRAADRPGHAGKKADGIDAAIADLEELDQDSLTRMRFAMKEPEVALRDIEVDIVEDAGDEGGGKRMNTQEATEIKRLKEARGLQNDAAGKD